MKSRIYNSNQIKLLNRISLDVDLDDIEDQEDLDDVYISVKVYDTVSKLWYWMDFHVEGDEVKQIYGEFNQSIFYTGYSDSETEEIRMNRQDDGDFFIDAECKGRDLLFKLNLISSDDDSEYWNLTNIKEILRLKDYNL